MKYLADNIFCFETREGCIDQALKMHPVSFLNCASLHRHAVCCRRLDVQSQNRYDTVDENDADMALANMILLRMLCSQCWAAYPSPAAQAAENQASVPHTQQR